MTIQFFAGAQWAHVATGSRVDSAESTTSSPQKVLLDDTAFEGGWEKSYKWPVEGCLGGSFS